MVEATSETIDALSYTSGAGYPKGGLGFLKKDHINAAVDTFFKHREILATWQGFMGQLPDHINCRSWTVERESNMKLSDAQILLNEETAWQAAEVIFVNQEASIPTTPEQIDACRKYTYKTMSSAQEGRLAHVITPQGTLETVMITTIRQPTPRDKLTAHKWLIVNGDVQGYRERTDKDAEHLKAIQKRIEERAAYRECHEALARARGEK